MAMKVSIKLNVTGADYEECCRGHRVKDVEEMSQCVECGGYICSDKDCDCTCPVYEEEMDD